MIHPQSSNVLTSVPEDSVELKTPSALLWEDLVHDLRQPLSMIECLAYHLEITTEDEHVCAQVKRIRSMVGVANRILEKRSFS